MSGIAKIEHGDAGAAIRRLAGPSILAFLSEQVLGIADTIAIGSRGAGALAAIAGAVSVFLVFGIGLFAFGSGLRIVGAQAIGAGRGDRFGTIVRSSTVTPVAIAVGIAILSFATATPLMRAVLPIGAPVGDAGIYLILRCCCLVPMALTGQAIVAFGTAGDTKFALRTLLAINAVHLPLLGVLALGFGTGHPLGLAGAGISSLTAETLGVVFAFVVAARRPELGIVDSWRIEARLVRSTTSLSWPEFVFLTLQIAPDPITIALLAPQGLTVVAAYRALSIVNDATWAVPGSLGDAAETIVGQRIGALDYAGARVFQRSALRIAITICCATGAGVAILAWPLAAAFTLNPKLATIAALPLAIHVAITLPLKGYAMAAVAPIRAAGDTRWVMRMGIATTAIAVTGIGLGIVVFHFGLYAVPFGWTTGWVFRDLATAARLRGRDWERRRIDDVHAPAS